jgi:hypothetical protein
MLQTLQHAVHGAETTRRATHDAAWYYASTH